MTSNKKKLIYEKFKEKISASSAVRCSNSAESTVALLIIFSDYSENYQKNALRGG